jgi:hypothetical protein
MFTINQGSNFLMHPTQQLACRLCHYKNKKMKLYTWGLLAALLLITGIACTRDVKEPIPNNILGKWILTDTQSAGIGPPGVWAVASPAGRWMEIQNATQISGNVFPNSSTYQLLDSVTLKVIDPSQSAGFRLFNFQLDTVNRVLYFFKRPPNGGYCFEGCGTYKFVR